MAKSRVEIEFKAVKADQLQKAINSLDKATKSLINSQSKLAKEGKKVKDTQEKLRTSVDKTKKGFFDLSNEGRLLDNTFATIRSKMLLVSFALSLGVRQLGRLVQESARVKSMETAFNTLAGSGAKASESLEKLKEATDNTMSSFDLFQQANNAMILGVTKNSDEMAEMFDIAQRLGRALGRDTASSVESLITGIGRQSRLMLDNIGIIVKSEDAYRKYAEANNLVAEKLTDSQKKQAFFDATMESARKKVESLGDETLSTEDTFAQLITSFSEAGLSIAETLTPAVISLSEALRAGAVVTKAFFDVFNSGLGKAFSSFKDNTVIPLQDQLELLKGKLLSLESQGLIKVNSSLGLFGDTIGAVPFEDSIFELGRFADGASFTQTQLNELVGELDKLKKAIKLEAEESALPFDKDTTTEAKNEIQNLTNLESERVRIIREASKELEKLREQEKSRQEKRNQFFKEREQQREKDNVEKLDEIRQSILKRTKEREDITRKVFGETTSFQLKELKKLEDAFLMFNEHTVESEQFFADERVRITQEEQEKKIQAQLEGASLFLSSFNSMTGAMEAGIESRKNNELNALRSTLSFQRASAEERKNMEHKLNQGFADEERRLFMLKKMSNMGQVIIDTAGAIAEALPNIPLSVLIGAMGSAQLATIASQQPPTFQAGGLVGGQRHSQGGTIIEAERGEFVMSRNAVQSIGVETLNQMNANGNTGVTVNISAPLVDETVVDTIIPAIEKATRMNLA